MIESFFNYEPGVGYLNNMCKTTDTCKLDLLSICLLQGFHYRVMVACSNMEYFLGSVGQMATLERWAL